MFKFVWLYPLSDFTGSGDNVVLVGESGGDFTDTSLVTFDGTQYVRTSFGPPTAGRKRGRLFRRLRRSNGYTHVFTDCDPYAKPDGYSDSRSYVFPDRYCCCNSDVYSDGYGHSYITPPSTATATFTPTPTAMAATTATAMFTPTPCSHSYCYTYGQRDRYAHSDVNSTVNTSLRLSTSIASNYNGTPINAGNYIWFTSVLKPSDLRLRRVRNR